MKNASMARCALGLVWAFAALACDSTRDTTCGSGTEQVARKCIPVESPRDAAAPDDAAADAADASDRACGEGTFERDGVCLARQPIGGPCTAGDQCLSGSCLMEDRGAPDGYCTIAGCSPARPCPMGAHCTFAAADETSVCLAYCDADDDCRSEEGKYVCQPLFTTDVNVCAPACQSNESCSAGTRCNRSSGKCEIHECVPGTLGVCSEDEDAGLSTDLICYAEDRGLSSTGGICLPRCDPKAPDEACASNEVCQPLAEDPRNQGFCAPPVCTTSEDCPVGALCMDRVCMPPVACDEGACGDGEVCVSDRCMPECPSEGCEALHSGLRCEPTTNACLPLGAFPGGECRNVLDAPCDPLAVERAGGTTESAPMICAADTCLVTCGEGGDALCTDVAASLTCAPAGIIAAAPVCLPRGSFPGGACGAGDACEPLAVGDSSVPMLCGANKCLITCDDAAGGDVLCAQIDASLRCVAGIFAEEVCLPVGSYPGGPCAPGDTCAQDLSGVDALDMFCASNTCLVQCEVTGPFADGNALCAAVDPSLACVSQAGTDFCAPM